MKNTFSIIMIASLVVGMLIPAFQIQPVIASGTIYIRADGSIDPPTAPISTSDNITYTFTDNIYDSIALERSNIVIDGAGYTLQGSGSDNGFYWSGINNVTAKNTNIKHFYLGILLSSSSNCSIVGNNITNSYSGLGLFSSSNGSIVGNNIAANTGLGILLFDSSNGSIVGNNITNNGEDGIVLDCNSDNSSIVGNNITNNGGRGITIAASSNNTISGNNITNNGYGIWLWHYWISSNNRFYHNNFINNVQQAYFYESGYGNVWDDGYPSGGNYWSDYTGVDEKSGPNQDQPGSDGIGDTPYVIDDYNLDGYPLVYRNIVVTAATPSKTVVGQNYSVNVSVTVENQGDFTETFNITTYASATVIGLENVTLPAGNSTTITFTWNTADFAFGNYSISAYASPAGNETNTTDNTFVDGWAIVTIPGDVNGDFKVDLYDIVKICTAYGSKQGEPAYVSNYDINGDGKIDLYDVVLACTHYGQTTP